MMGHDGICPICMLMYMYHIYIQLFRERLSEKVHATIPIGIEVVLSALFSEEI